MLKIQNRFCRRVFKINIALVYLLLGSCKQPAKPTTFGLHMSQVYLYPNYSVALNNHYKPTRLKLHKELNLINTSILDKKNFLIEIDTTYLDSINELIVSYGIQENSKLKRYQSFDGKLIPLRLFIKEAQLYNKDLKIWIDLKNLNTKNALSICKQIKNYDSFERIFVESTNIEALKALKKNGCNNLIAWVNPSFSKLSPLKLASYLYSIYSLNPEYISQSYLKAQDLKAFFPFHKKAFWTNHLKIKDFYKIDNIEKISSIILFDIELLIQKANNK